MSQKNAGKHLRIASLLEILLGVVSIVGLRMMLGSDQAFAGLPDAVAQSALFGVLYIYVANGAKVLAGILGLLLAGRRSLLTVLLGGLMFLVQLVSFVQVGQDMVQIVIHIVLLVIPYYYLHNAVKIYRSK